MSSATFLLLLAESENGTSPPSGDEMLFEDGTPMSFENGTDMQYEG